MRKEIELSPDYIMLLSVLYCKNVSKGNAEYLIESKIVKKTDYAEDPECIGEIEGSYIKRIPQHLSKHPTTAKYFKEKTKRKVLSTIELFHKFSKRLVSEWEQRNDIIQEAELLVAELSKNDLKREVKTS